MSELLSRYEKPWAFTDGIIAHPIYSLGSGPDVVVIHELPGMTEACLQLGIDLTRKFRVHLPLLFGEPAHTSTWKNIRQICCQREIFLFASNRTSPVVGWLRALCRELQSRSGIPGVGVIGMCVTGGFALALFADKSVLAPVVAQPSCPVGFWNKSALGMSKEDAAAVRQRAQNCGAKCVLGLRYKGDRTAPAKRITAIQDLIGPALDYFPIPGNKHSTLTKDRDEGAFQRTMDFLSERLKPDSTSSPVA
jgi:dienelactone hydrolase